MTLYGSPVSLDSAYRTGRMPVKRKSGPVLNADGQQKYIHRPILTKGAEQWRDACQIQMQAAKPSSWAPVGRIRVRWTFYVTRLVDSDNLLKLPSDALERATGVNDSLFNHCIEDVIVVSDPREARTEVVVDSEPGCCCT